MSSAPPRMGRDRGGTVGSEGKRSRVEEVIETVATALGNGVGRLAENGVLFAIFAVMWVAFSAALIWSQGSLDQAWEVIKSLPLVVQILVWVLFLPVMIGLWVWETSWPLIVRLVLVFGIAGWNLVMFLPRALPGR